MKIVIGLIVVVVLLVGGILALPPRSFPPSCSAGGKIALALKGPKFPPRPPRPYPPMMGGKRHDAKPSIDSHTLE